MIEFCHFSFSRKKNTSDIYGFSMGKTRKFGVNRLIRDGKEFLFFFYVFHGLAVRVQGCGVCCTVLYHTYYS
jgi:hypothetical protein